MPKREDTNSRKSGRHGLGAMCLDLLCGAIGGKRLVGLLDILGECRQRAMAPARLKFQNIAASFREDAQAPFA